MATTTLTNNTISETYISLLHSNGEILPATGQEWVYDGCGNQSSIKIGRCSDNAGLTVCGPISASDWSTLIDLIYPVGSVFFSVDNVNPGDRFTGTTWVQVSEGRFIAGVGTGTDINANTYTVTVGEDSSAGEYTHQLTIDEMPAHTHKGVMNYPWDTISESTEQNQKGRPEDFVSINTETAPAGGNQSHNNILPYFGLYVWRRTA